MLLLQEPDPARLVIVEQIKSLLLQTTITGKQYDTRLATAIPAKVWDQVWVLLDELAT
jgi:hypothetical protein